MILMNIGKLDAYELDELYFETIDEIAQIEQYGYTNSEDYNEAILDLREIVEEYEYRGQEIPIPVPYPI